MLRSPNRNPRIRDTTSIAGWLFADLFLGLIIVFMASFRVEKQQFKIDVNPSATPTIATSTPNKPTLTAEPTEVIGLDLEPKVISVYMNNTSRFLSNDPESTKSFLAQFEKNFPLEYKNRRAGLVIALGYDTSGNISKARKIANRAVFLLETNYPSIFSNIVKKTFWWEPDAIRPIGTIEMEIYFFTE